MRIIFKVAAAFVYFTSSEMASTKSTDSNFALVAWEGKKPTWSILNRSLLQGVVEPGKRTQALWGKKKYACEILAIAGVYIVYNIANTYFVLTLSRAWLLH